KAYGLIPYATGGLCIKILVERKKRPAHKKERIPSSIYVTVNNDRKRVPLDVMSVGDDKDDSPIVTRMNDGRGWPVAGSIQPGRLFAFGVKTADQINAEFPESKEEVRLGTTGAIVHFGDETYYGISAGHIFTDPCVPDPVRPHGIRAIGALGNNWVEVTGEGFYPPTIKSGDWIRDVMLFPVPQPLKPDIETISWPPDFTRELATPEDIDYAVQAETATGFVWIDRGGDFPEAIPVDLEAGFPLFETQVGCFSGAVKTLTYRMTWPLRFTDERQNTMGGDSGAPVFLYTGEGDGCRLLGFHFMESTNDSYSFAMDAGSFFREVLLSTPGEDVWFC
ncbi:MAG: hypothetical protein MI892_31760, partial [Desulfobacterales bacterium]|nr:hypothetical protein [Desulfobacterales bacterium]